MTASPNLDAAHTLIGFRPRAIDYGQLSLDVRYIFGTQEGRRVLEYLLESFHFFNTTMQRAPLAGDSYGGVDMHAMAVAEGQRMVILDLLWLLDARTYNEIRARADEDASLYPKGG